jgi:hypothetical protein
MKIIQDIEKSEQLDEYYQNTTLMWQLKRQELEDRFFENLESCYPDGIEDGQLYDIYGYEHYSVIADIMGMFWDENLQEFTDEDPETREENGYFWVKYEKKYLTQDELLDAGYKYDLGDSTFYKFNSYGYICCDENDLLCSIEVSPRLLDLEQLGYKYDEEKDEYIEN